MRNAYVRHFVLLGHPRNGSTMLALALGQHPNVVMFGELFNDEVDERHRAFRMGRRLAKHERGSFIRRSPGFYGGYQVGEDAAAFLSDRIFVPREIKEPSATGFKLFYHQARTEGARRAWTYLREHPSLLVLHLYRDNLLECLLSLRTAQTTGKWVQTVDQPEEPDQPRLHISPIECLRYFERIERDRKCAAEFFCNCTTLRLKYESDLCNNFSVTMDRIQHFLRIPRTRVTSLTRKQARAEPSFQIVNYAELVDFFTDTSYARHFRGRDDGDR